MLRALSIVAREAGAHTELEYRSYAAGQLRPRQRPDIRVSGVADLYLLSDVMITTPTASSHVVTAATTPLAAASKGERSKEAKCAAFAATEHTAFHAFVLESFGAFGPAAVKVLHSIVSHHIHSQHATSFLLLSFILSRWAHSVIDIALQRGNSALVHTALRAGRSAYLQLYPFALEHKNFPSPSSCFTPPVKCTRFETQIDLQREGPPPLHPLAKCLLSCGAKCLLWSDRSSTALVLRSKHPLSTIETSGSLDPRTKLPLSGTAQRHLVPSSYSLLRTIPAPALRVQLSVFFAVQKTLLVETQPQATIRPTKRTLLDTMRHEKRLVRSVLVALNGSLLLCPAIRQVVSC